MTLTAPNRKPLLRRVRSCLVRWRGSISCLCILVSVVWINLFTVMNISSGEGQPRSTFISENAILLNYAKQEYDNEDASYAQQLFLRYHQEVPFRNTTLTIEWFRQRLQECTIKDIEQQTYGYPFYTCPSFPSDNPSLAPCVWVSGTLRARAGAAGSEGILLIAPLPVHEISLSVYNNTEWESIDSSFLLLSILHRFSRSKWRSKDIIVLFTTDPLLSLSNRSATLSSSSSLPIPNVYRSLGVESWLRSYHYDALEEYRTLFTSSSLSSSLADSIWGSLWLKFYLVFQPWTSFTTHVLRSLLYGTMVTQNDDSLSAISLFSRIQPTKFTSGPIRGSIVLDSSNSPKYSPNEYSVLVQGIGGMNPELDFYTGISRSLFMEQHPIVSLPSNRKFSLQHSITSSSLSFTSILRYTDYIQSQTQVSSSYLRKILKFFRISLPLVDRWLQRTRILLQYGLYQYWSNGGYGLGHSECLRQGIPSVTLQALYPPEFYNDQYKLYQQEKELFASSSVRWNTSTVYDSPSVNRTRNIPSSPPPTPMIHSSGPAVSHRIKYGMSIEKFVRALNGLDERLHASTSFYLLMGPDLFVGLTEYIIPYAILHVPILIYTLTQVPTGQSLLYGIVLFSSCIGYGCLCHYLFMNENIFLYRWIDGLVSVLFTNPRTHYIPEWIVFLTMGQAIFLRLIIPLLQYSFGTIIPLPPITVSSSSYSRASNEDTHALTHTVSSSSSSSAVSNVQNVGPINNNNTPPPTIPSLLPFPMKLLTLPEIQQYNLESILYVCWLYWGFICYPLVYYNYSIALVWGYSIVGLLFLVSIGTYQSHSRYRNLTSVGGGDIHSSSVRYSLGKYRLRWVRTLWLITHIGCVWLLFIVYDTVSKGLRVEEKGQGRKSIGYSYPEDNEIPFHYNKVIIDSLYHMRAIYQIYGLQTLLTPLLTFVWIPIHTALGIIAWT